MRLTIEGLRTLVLAAGVLLVLALGVFFGTARLRNRFSKRDLPHSLGRDIQEEANGFVYTHEVRGHVLYKIRASKQVQLKKDGKVLLELHDVTIELYAEDGSRVDRIEGGEFEYNPGAGLAKAVGPVEISLMKPSVAPAIVPRASASQALGSRQMTGSLASAAQTAANGEVHVKTSGLVFDRNSGEASTTEKVEFSLAQGKGSAVGARYDSHDGQLVLEQDVELSMQRGNEPMRMFAQHAEFRRQDQACTLKAATVRYGDDASSAEEARIYFRDDGSAERLDAGGGVWLSTPLGGRIAAPTGTLAFDRHNQPVHGHLEGGVTVDSENKGRILHGGAPVMDLVFAERGVLRSAHLERGVRIASDEQKDYATGARREHREWSSPIADLRFRDLGRGKVEAASMHGAGGVVVTGTSTPGSGPATLEKMTADDVMADFGPRGTLKGVTGRGHAVVEQTTAAGVQQSTSGDILVAHLLPPGKEKIGAGPHAESQIESGSVDGHVVLVSQPGPRAGVAQPATRVTAGHAEFDSRQWLHLTENPRLVDAGLELTADRLNVAEQSGDAIAQGDVRATWTGDGKQSGSQGSMPVGLGSQGPAHVVAQRAEFKRASGTATFKGDVRMWQQGSSVTAATIVLDRVRQTMTAQSTSAKSPVQVVLVSTGSLPGRQETGNRAGPSLVRVEGGELRYSGAQREAVMKAGVSGEVVASTSDTKTTSSEVNLVLLPPGNHAGRDGTAAEVDRITSSGHVQISASSGRRGVGEKLVYTSETGNYVLTGTSTAPPRLIDPTRGTVTGQALIFNSRDDSVSIEGDGQKTTTKTTAPK